MRAILGEFPEIAPPRSNEDEKGNDKIRSRNATADLDPFAR